MKMTWLLAIVMAAPIANATGQQPLIANKGLEISESEIEGVKLDALRGSGLAAFRLHNYYDVVSYDKKESIYWATIAAENDYPSGMYELGFKLAAEKDPASRLRARYWLQKALKNGVPLARGILDELDKSSK